MRWHGDWVKPRCSKRRDGLEFHLLELTVLEEQMPLARIDIVRGKSADYKRTIADVVYEAVIDILKAPANDRFQVIAEHAIHK